VLIAREADNMFAESGFGWRVMKKENKLRARHASA
jgi:hypothetical protein